MRGSSNFACLWGHLPRCSALHDDSCKHITHLPAHKLLLQCGHFHAAGVRAGGPSRYLLPVFCPSALLCPPMPYLRMCCLSLLYCGYESFLSRFLCAGGALPVVWNRLSSLVLVKRVCPVLSLSLLLSNSRRTGLSRSLFLSLSRVHSFLFLSSPCLSRSLGLLS